VIPGALSVFDASNCWAFLTISSKVLLGVEDCCSNASIRFFEVGG